MNKQEYIEYLQSSDWKNKKSKKKIDKCTICGSRRRLDVHHLQYRNIYDVTPEDLRVVCRNCHTIWHDLVRNGKVIPSKSHNGNRFAQMSKEVKKVIGRTPKEKKVPKLTDRTPTGRWGILVSQMK